MQPSPPVAPPNPRTTSFRYILVGALFVLVGSVFSYSSGLVYAFSFPDPFSANQGLMQAANIVSILGGILAALGFFLAFYGIALRLRLLATEPRPGAVPVESSAPPVATPLPLARAPGTNSYAITVLGGGLVLLGRLIAVGATILLFLLPSMNLTGFTYLQAYYSINFAGNVLAAVGFLAAFYGIALSIHRTR